ncbi:MAG TPA: hypothetical protein VGS03_10585 [Candidatus Polarisedimenticolia bacterium]|jgi:hypothetical protein|nr:hypothetical protein [Candidatus Polarisedimenticolia bacterium]
MTRSGSLTTLRALGLGLVVALSALTSVPAFAGGDQAVSLSDEQVVPAGKVHDGDLVSVMGDVRVEGKVTGTVVCVLGDLKVTGSVDGDVVSIMSRTDLGDAANISGEFVNVGWTPLGVNGASIGGEKVNVNFMNLIPFAGHGGGLSGLLRFLFILALIKLAMLFLTMVIVTSLVPRRLAVMASAFPQKWGWSFVVGLLTYVGIWIGVLFLAVTLIGIPLALFLWFAGKVIKWMGLAAILYLMGQTIGRNLWGRQLPHLASVLAGFVIFAVTSMIPGIGWVFSGVMSVLAVGIAITTRLGAEPVVQPSTAGPGGLPVPPSWEPAPAGGPSMGPGPGSTPA